MTIAEVNKKILSYLGFLCLSAAPVTIKEATTNVKNQHNEQANRNNSVVGIRDYFLEDRFNWRNR